MQRWRQESFSTKQCGKDGLPATIHLTTPLLQLHKGRRSTTTFTCLAYCTCMYHPTDLAYPAPHECSPRLVLAEYFDSRLHSYIFAACISLASNPPRNHAWSLPTCYSSC